MTQMSSMSPYSLHSVLFKIQAPAPKSNSDKCSEFYNGEIVHNMGVETKTV